MNNSSKKPLFIISAARSGSKILREILSSSNEFSFYPYDINYIWKYKNLHINHDELKLSHLDNEKIEYIRKYFSRINNADKRILEKTVSNSLRLEFIKAIYPDAQIIHLHRDGREVTASIKSCWIEPTISTRNQSWSLLAKKIIDFPFRTSTLYLIKHLKNNFSLFSPNKTLKSWGPRFEGIDDVLKSKSLIEVCALQWAIPEKKTMTYLEKQDPNNFITIKYEDLVTNPRKTLLSVNEFLGIHNIEKVCDYAESTLRQNTRSSWHTLLTEEERELALPILSKQLEILKYI